MDTGPKEMPELFAQLGLPSSPEDIKSFINQHRPLDDNTRLADAPIWNSSQAEFLKEKLRDDSDWAMLIDNLSAQLRAHPETGSLPHVGSREEPVGDGNVAAARRQEPA